MSSGGGHGGGGFELPGLHDLHEALESSNGTGGFIVPGWLMLVIYAIAAAFFAATAPLQSALNWNLLLVLGPLWLPIVIGRFAMWRFITMRQMNYNARNPLILLEIRIPRDTRKTPQAMETFFSHIHINPGEGTWLKKWWWGRTRPWWSFEIASFGGEIHFFIATRKDFRRLIESAMYAQYPEVEIIEAKDYSRLRDPSHDPYQMFACEYQHTKGKPDAYPIRTYVEHGSDKPGTKPEEQVDQFSQVLELFGSLGPGEELWTQIVIRVTKGEKWRGKKGASGKAYNWKDAASAEVKKLREDAIFKTSVPTREEGVTQILESPTDVTRDLIKAIERNAAKQAFDVGMRSIYSAPRDKYRTMNPFVANVFKPYTGPNAIEPAPFWSEKFNDYPWEDVGGHRQRHEMHEVTEAFRARSFYYPPYRGPWMIMSVEELASIYHIPSATTKTPGLPRIGSTTSSAPSNLPQ